MPKASSAGSGRAYIDNRRMQRAEEALERLGTGLLTTLDSDTLVVRYFFDRGLEAVERSLEKAEAVEK